MNPRLILAARLLLAAVLAVALYGAVNPRHVHVWAVPPDAVEHVVYAFGLVTLGAAALPGAPLWLVAAPWLCAGAGLEALQALGLVAGTAQLGDALANIAGVGAALLALGVGASRRRPSRR